MRNEGSVGPQQREGLAHEDGGVEWTLGKFEPLDFTPIETHRVEAARLGASCRDHRRRIIHAHRLDSASRQNLTMRRVAAREVEHPPDGPPVMAPPDLLQECGLLLDFPRTFHVYAAEDVGEFVNARL